MFSTFCSDYFIWLKSCLKDDRHAMVIALIIKFLRKVVKKSNIWKSWDHVKTNYRRWVSLASVKQTSFFMTPSPIESLLFCVSEWPWNRLFLDHFSSVMSDDKNLEKKSFPKVSFSPWTLFYTSLSLSPNMQTQLNEEF